MPIIQRIPGTNLMPLTGMTSQLKTTTFVEGGITPVSLFKECIGAVLVLADETDNDPLKNDFSSFISFQFPGTTVEYFLLDGQCNEIAPLNDGTYGTYYPQGSWTILNGFTLFQSLYKGYKVDWLKVLQIEGHGYYQIKKVVSDGFTTTETRSCLFDLCQFTDERADETARIETIQNGKIGFGLDFRGINWEQQIRIPGFFGNKQRRLEQDDYLDKNRRVTQIQDTLIHEYTLEPALMPPCMREFIDEILLANNILISDYNELNTDNLKNIDVKPISIDTEYFAKSNRAADEIKFEERIQNRVKRNVK